MERGLLTGYRLLTAPGANPKLAKNLAMGYITAGLQLSPANESGRNLCPAHSPGCAAACLYWSGRGRMATVQKQRLAKTALWNEEPAVFMQLLKGDLAWLAMQARKLGAKPACRMNVTSDIAWEKLDLLEQFPEISFYDYTKRRDRRELDNYRIVFSRSEINGTLLVPTLETGRNVAVVFGGHVLPDTYRGYPVIDGDVHDCRFLDPTPVIVGLRAKGQKARLDESGFVVRVGAVSP